MTIELYNIYINEKGCRKVKLVTNIEIGLGDIPRKGEIIIHEGIEYNVDFVIHNLDDEETIVKAYNR